MMIPIHARYVVSISGIQRVAKRIVPYCIALTISGEGNERREPAELGGIAFVAFSGSANLVHTSA